MKPVDVDTGDLTLIAEAATCHGGDLGLAIKMVGAAADAGATHVKFQHVDPLYFSVRTEALGYNLREWYTRCRFSQNQWGAIILQCGLDGIKFLCTPQTSGDFADLVKLGIGEVKISSDNVTNLPLLRAVNEWGGIVYMSGGIASVDEMVDAMEVLPDCTVHRLVCTSQYPCPPENANLLRLNSWWWGDTKATGFSDHTYGADAALIALGLGANIFEKHFRLEAEAHGPDASFSGDEYDLADYCERLKIGATMFGDGKWRADR